ncbi:hypothetical protein M0804_014948 [Polistes exclamans]|nr:hypothetical protein M0804_014950 [Polistes exclamans]KAI4474239.1 hypothetical protein M0804_014948 [Polistes exclamans]
MKTFVNVCKTPTTTFQVSKRDGIKRNCANEAISRILRTELERLVRHYRTPDRGRLAEISIVRTGCYSDGDLQYLKVKDEAG